MAKNSKSMSSACTVILDDNDSAALTMMQVPFHLVKSYGEELPPVATLRIDDSGKFWKVKVEKFNEQYFFTDGWKDFAQVVDLNSWDYLLFNSAGSSGSIDPNHVLETESVQDEDKAPDRDEEEASRVSKSWSFTKELKISHVYRLELPDRFAVSTGILATRKVKLKDAQGRAWSVCVTTPHRGIVCLSAGWHRFLVTNKVTVGSIMSFSFNPDSGNAIEARLLKMGTNRKALFQYVKQREGRYQIVASSKAGRGRVRGRSDQSIALNIERDKDDHTTQDEDVDCVENARKVSKRLKKHHT